MTTVVLAEKPSVARDIAAVLGATRRRTGFLEGAGYRVTWAVGHLVGLGAPPDVNPAWRRWSFDTLPMLPKRWPLVPRDSAADQLAIVRRLMNQKATRNIICATDAGREGELIFRYIYEHIGCTKPVERLWISSLTPSAIQRGLNRLVPASRYDDLASAARARSQADWLVGMNCSRAYTLRSDEVLSVGRVQTPTLAMLVRRELSITQFVPEAYHEVHATFQTNVDEAAGTENPSRTYKGIYVAPDPPSRTQGARSAHSPPPRSQARLPADGQLAEAIAKRAMTGEAILAQVAHQKKRFPPLRLYDLTDLQRHANRLYGFSARRTLDLAQELYEKHKLISYPRTDSRYLTQDIADTLVPIVSAVEPSYQKDVHLSMWTGQTGQTGHTGQTGERQTSGGQLRPLSRRFVDDSKVTDHHAIIPTTGRCRLGQSTPAFKVYDLICRRFLQAWCDDHIEAITRVLTKISGQAEGVDFVDDYRSRGSSVEQEGWKRLDVYTTRSRNRAHDLPGGLKQGLAADVLKADVAKKETKPPRRFDDSTLLTAMETAGRTLDDRKLSDAMRESGLGTPATRAGTIETLIKREYILREGKKSLRATPKGIDLIARVHNDVKSPAMTGEWELRLTKMARGEERLDLFMADIERFVTEVVGSAERSPSSGISRPASRSSSLSDSRSERAADSNSNNASPRERSRQQSSRHDSPRQNSRPWEATTSTALAATPTPPRETREPTPADQLPALLKKTFGFEFRRHQEEICSAVTRGVDTLVVMPTGAGKSLCYQLPGLARAGTTVVISPLVALIEDQVQKLQAAGLAAERIHSGRGRQASRDACDAYLAGELDYLFIAPERLGVRGFPQMLQKRPPSLIAIDEAHCISDWGHDFRPDYRMIKERLDPLRPEVPIVALTATATPRVQADICAQLELGQGNRAEQFILGFRRTNIGVEVVEVPKNQRAAAAWEVLKAEDRLPAIVYASTRKSSEEVAAFLGKKARVGVYHAGLSQGDRDNVQRRFTGSDLDVVVATVAFGMGIDKANVRTVVHTALPATLEGYYQEIGRAGRDGQPSRAVLMHSYADIRTLEFFLERGYPPVARLARVHKHIKTPIHRTELRELIGGKREDAELWINKLWIAGGAAIDEDGTVRRAGRSWRKNYEKQREHKEAQLASVRAFGDSHECRMRHLVRHFGDREDSGNPCGICDICTPEDTLLSRAEGASKADTRLARAILSALKEWDDQSTGRLYRQLCEDGSHDTDRDGFNALLGAMQRAGWVKQREDSFDKDGKSIRFRRVGLVQPGKSPPSEAELSALQLPRPTKFRTTKSTSRFKSKRSRSSKGKTQLGRTRKAPSRAKHIAGPAELVDALKTWRAATAKKKRIPAYRILSDVQLGEVATAAPSTRSALQEINGIGPKKMERWSTDILKVVRANRD